MSYKRALDSSLETPVCKKQVVRINDDISITITDTSKTTCEQIIVLVIAEGSTCMAFPVARSDQWFPELFDELQCVERDGNAIQVSDAMSERAKFIYRLAAVMFYSFELPYKQCYTGPGILGYSKRKIAVEEQYIDKTLTLPSFKDLRIDQFVTRVNLDGNVRHILIMQ